MKTLWFVLGVILIGLIGCAPSNPFSDDPRDKFLGRYSVAETCSPSKVQQNYSFQILKSANDTDSLVTVENFYNSGAKIEGIVTGNRVAFPSQTFAAYTFSGNGTVFTKQESTERFIELTYIVQVSPGNFADTCQAKAIVQE